jgi:hypothetical protein
MPPQPDDTTCGPTCLHAVYRYYGDDLPLDRIIAEVPTLEDGGTLGVFLACHALRRGYRARIYTYNLRVFDPTWLVPEGPAVVERLQRQLELRPEPKLALATRGYLDFLALGGELRLDDLSPMLIRKHLDRGQPILTGLSATFLYRSARERGTHVLEPDDLLGDVVGHFVVLTGYDREQKKVLVADPYHGNPYSQERLYEVGIHRVINATLLGILTYDANLLVIEPRGQGSGAGAAREGVGA